LLLSIAIVAYEAQSPGKDSGKLPANAASGRAETPKQSKLLLAEFKGDFTLSVKQVGALVGFPDPFQFSRSFKRQFGYPPSARRDG